MAGGFLLGLGRGIESAGDAYAKAKQAAIDRMFREQQLAMQQQQLDANIANQQFQQTRDIFSQLPGGTDVSGLDIPKGGLPVFEAFSKKGTRPDPTLPAKTLPMPVTLPPTTGEGEWQGSPAMPVQQTEATMPVQDLTPKIDTRTSVPFEDTRARTAMFTEQGRRDRHAATLAMRERIQGMKDAVAREGIATTDAQRRAALSQGWARIDALQKNYELRLREVDADIANMEYDNLLRAWEVEHGRPAAGANMNDPVATLRAMEAFRTGTPIGAVPGVAPGAAETEKTSRPSAPQPSSRPGAGGPGAAAQTTSPAHQEYLRRRAQRGQ